MDWARGGGSRRKFSLGDGEAFVYLFSVSLVPLLRWPSPRRGLDPPQGFIHTMIFLLLFLV